MEQQLVQFVETSPVSFTYDDPTKYGVRADKRAVWLQRICCWVLHKLGAFYQNHETKYSHQVVDVSNAVHLIYRQVDTLTRDYYQSPERILIGSEEFMQMCGVPTNQAYFSYDATGPKFGRLKITVVPWMKGILVMPKEK